MPELVWRGKGVAASARSPVLRTAEIYGDSPPAGYNRLIAGDAHAALAALARGSPDRPSLTGGVGLVYVDPPFDTGGTFAYRASIPDAAKGTPRIEVHAYDDARGLDAWLTWFHRTSLLLRDLLVEGGSLYVHLDAHAAHYAKVVLDEVLGPQAFQREIVWRIGWVSGFKSRARGWIRNHDALLFYAKGGKPRTFHKQYIPYPTGYVRRDGVAPRGAGYPVDDVWNGSDIDRMDSIQIISFSREKAGYPTQKNEALVARVVRASSNPGDIVLDCCVGSGTAAVVAEKLGRRWIACDSGALAIHATRKRLLQLDGLGPFVVETAGKGTEVTAKRKLAVEPSVQGRTVTLNLASFALPHEAVPAGVRAAVHHPSQWIEGWCVDWHHRGGPLRATARSWRAPRKRLAVDLSHTYTRRGRYVALVRVFDLLGGVTTKKVRFQIR